MREAYHLEGATDLEVARKQASDRLTDRDSPQETIIHHHEKGLPCEGSDHDVFSFPKAEDAGA